VVFPQSHHHTEEEKHDSTPFSVSENDSMQDIFLHTGKITRE
jgi:hypothetical protein